MDRRSFQKFSRGIPRAADGQDDEKLCTNPSTVADGSTLNEGAVPFKVHINFDIPIFEVQINADAIDK
jgi:hypothetical protein